jgi:2-methylcitrate dehydratase
VSLLDGAITHRSFDKRRLADSALSSLMQKIRVVRQPEFMGRYPQALPTRVTVRTQSGKEYAKQVDYPLGHPRNPMPDHEVEEKFLKLAAGQLGRARAREVIDLVWQLDLVKDISTLMPLLKVKRKG